MKKCLNLSIPQFKQAAKLLGEVEASKIVDTFPEGYVPSLKEILDKSKITKAPQYPFIRIVQYYESGAIAKRNNIIKQYGEESVTPITKSKDGRNRDIYAFSARIPVDEQRVNYQLRLQNILTNPTDKVKQYFNGLKKGTLTIQQFVDKAQIPREQKPIVIQSWNNQNTLEQLILDILANYSYTVEINTGKQFISPSDKELIESEGKATSKEVKSSYYSNLTVPGGTNYTENEIATPAITPSIKGHAQFATDKGIGWFRSDEQVSGFKNKKATPSRLFPLGFGGQEEIGGKTRRILEVQSDLFQKGRDKKDLINGKELQDNYNAQYNDNIETFYDADNNRYFKVEDGKETTITEKEFNSINSPKESSKNQFLQLLNKDNNWVTFFIKSIIQDSAKKGYEKVLFPTGNTASKVEGHSTLEEFKKQKENRIKELEADNEAYKNVNKLGDSYNLKHKYPESFEKYVDTEKHLNDILTIKKANAAEINQLKQELERVEREGFGALKPIYNFYENTVANILNKQFGQVNKITDEYGNTWNEIDVTNVDVVNPIELQRDNLGAIGSEVSKDTLLDVLTRLRSKFGVDFIIDESLTTLGEVDPISGKVKINPNKAGLDTPFHEFAHLLIRALKQKNPKLYSNLIREMKSGKGTSILNLVKEVYPDYSEARQDEEALVTLLGLEAADEYLGLGKIVEDNRSFIQKIWDFIGQIFSDLFGMNKPDLSSFSTIGDLVDLLVNEEKIDLSIYGGILDQQRDVNTAYTSAYNKANDVQKAVLDKINEGILSYNFKVDQELGQYVSDELPGVALDRTTWKLQQDQFFSFDEDVATKSVSTDWGNIIDRIGDVIFQEGTQEDVYEAIEELGETEGKVDNAIIQDLIKIFSTMKRSKPNSVFITQLVPFNLEKGLAGSIDILEITPKGKILLYDIKSSKYSTVGDYTYTGADGKEYTRNYINPYKKDKASMKQKHEAQLSIYKGLLASKGILVSDINIIPIFINDTNNNTVIGVINEPIRTTEDTTLDEQTNLSIEYSKDSQYQGEQATIKDDILEAKSLHEKVLILLEEEIQKLQTEGGAYSKLRQDKLTKLQGNIRGIKAAIALERFIENLYSTFVEYKTPMGEMSDATTFNIEFSKIKSKINKNQYTSEIDKIKDLEGLLSHIEMYEDTVNELKEFYYKSMAEATNTVEKEATLDKIQKTIQAFDLRKASIKEFTQPALAKILGSLAQKELKLNIEPHINKMRGEMDKALKRLEDTYRLKISNNKANENVLTVEYNQKRSNIVNKYTQQIENLSEFLGDEESILNLLKVGYTGLGKVDKMLSSMKDMPNPLLAQFAKLYERELGVAREKLQSWGVGANKAIKDFGGTINLDSNNINEEFITQDGDNLAMVSEIDHDAFRKARELAYSKIELEFEDNQEIRKARKEWNIDNTEVVGFEDVVIKNPYSGETITLIKGINTVVAEQEAIFEKEYGSRSSDNYINAMINWKAANMPELYGDTVYMGPMFRVPKKSIYKSDKYEAIMNDPTKKKYYEFLVFTFAKAHLMYPKHRDYRTIMHLPSIHKGTTDRLTQNGIINYAKFSWNNTLGKVGEEDISLYGSKAMGLKKSVPIKYQSKLEIDEISRDLMSSAALYLKSASDYQVQSMIKPVGELLKSSMKLKGEKYTVGGSKYLRRSAEALGLNVEKYLNKNGDNMTLAILESYIDNNIYGISELYEPIKLGGKEVNGGKVANLLMQAMSLTSIAAKPLLAFANILQQNYMVAMEAAAGEFTSGKTWSKALAKYLGHEVDFLSDMTEPTKKSLIGQLIDIYDPIMGNFTDHFGRKISQGHAKKLMQTSSLYYGMKKGDHQTYVTSMLAMLMENKVKTVDGVEMSLLDAYELDEYGEITLKKGITLNQGTNYAGSKISFEVKEKMDAMNRRLNGVYDKLNKPDIEKAAIGRLTTMFRKFIVPGIKKRYKRRGIDHSLGTVTEGYYISFFRLLLKESKELLDFVTFNENNLLKEEKQNVKRFLFEAITTTLLSVAIALLQGMYEDEDDEETKKTLAYPLYLTFRLRSELGFFYNPVEILRILRSPTVTYTQIERIIKVLAQLTDPLEEYKRDTGPFKKGESKLKAYSLKMVGYNGYTNNPDVAYENLLRIMAGIR